MVARSLTLATRCATSDLAGIVDPAGMNAIVNELLAPRRILSKPDVKIWFGLWPAAASFTSFHFATCSSPSLPPAHLVTPSWNTLPVASVSVVSVIDTPTWSRNLPSVALRPAALSTNGWMWMSPSPCVWMPCVSCCASVNGGWYSPGTSPGAAIVVDVGAVVVVVSVAAVVVVLSVAPGTVVVVDPVVVAAACSTHVYTS